MIKRYISWDEFNGKVSILCREISISGWKPTYIVGLSRGGLIPATMMSHYFNIPMLSLNVSLRDNPDFKESMKLVQGIVDCPGSNVLIIDDLNDTGNTINWIFENLQIFNGDVKFAVLYDNETSKSCISPDYSAETINKSYDDRWLVFPWENWWTNKM